MRGQTIRARDFVLNGQPSHCTCVQAWVTVQNVTEEMVSWSIQPLSSGVEELPTELWATRLTLADSHMLSEIAAKARSHAEKGSHLFQLVFKSSAFLGIFDGVFFIQAFTSETEAKATLHH